MATRRSSSAKQIGNTKFARRRSNNNRKKIINGKPSVPNAAAAAISELHKQLAPEKHNNLLARSEPDTTTLSTNVLQAMGISVSNNSQRRKKGFSVVKTQKSSMVVKNPAILDLYSFKRLPRLPVPANSIFKNQNDAFFAASADQKLSRAQRKTMEKHMTPNPVDLSGIALSIIKKSSDHSSSPLRALQIRGKY